MTLEGYKELYVNLDKHEKAATKAAMEGLKRAGKNIITDALIPVPKLVGQWVR